MGTHGSPKTIAVFLCRVPSSYRRPERVGVEILRSKERGELEGALQRKTAIVFGLP